MVAWPRKGSAPWLRNRDKWPVEQGDKTVAPRSVARPVDGEGGGAHLGSLQAADPHQHVGQVPHQDQPHGLEEGHPKVMSTAPWTRYSKLRLAPAQSPNRSRGVAERSSGPIGSIPRVSTRKAVSDSGVDGVG
jgi:hypothetical protein